MRPKLSLFLMSFLFSVHALAVPSEAFEAPSVAAVEPRMYNPKYDITAELGVLPIDAFYKGFSLGASYTHTFSSSWSWEVINANTVSTTDTNLKTDLIENFNVRPAGILDSISMFGTTNLVYTPIYSKNLLFNTKLLYGSMSFVLGGGMVGFKSGDKAAMYGGGAILRVFHSENYSSKFDFRLYMHAAANKSSDMILLLTYGLSFELGDNKPRAEK